MADAVRRRPPIHRRGKHLLPRQPPRHGALHQETLYSKPYKLSDGNGKTVECRHVRKPLQNMSADEVENIVDDTVRKLVQARLAQIGGEPKKVFADPANHPYLTAGDGRCIFIDKARIRKAVAVIPLGKSASPRYAAPGSNHHVEIYAVLDEQGNEKKWEARTVTLMEACAASPGEAAGGPTRPRPKHQIQILAGGGRIRGNGTPTGGAASLSAVEYIGEGVGISFAYRCSPSYSCKEAIKGTDYAQSWQTLGGQSTEGGRRPLRKYPSGP